MNSSYDVVSYKPEFKEQVIQLQTQLWSPSLELNRAYFDWKYERNPYITTPLLYLALHQGTVVGMRGFFGVRWETDSPRQCLTGLYADDMVIDRDHRKRGLMRLVMEAAFEDLTHMGHEYVFNLSAGAVTHKSSLRMGWQSAGSMRPMRWQSWRFAGRMGMHRVARHFPEFSHRSTRRLAAMVRKSTLPEVDRSQSLTLSRLPSDPLISFTVAPRADAMSRLVDQLISNGGIRHVRDRAYLEWRFQNPLSRYGFLFCEGESLEGYLVLQEYTSESADRSVLNIVDWEGTSTLVLKRLLGAAQQIAGHRRRLVFWSATQSKERLALLAQHGFQLVDEEQGTGRHRPELLVRAIVQGLPASEWLFAGRRLADMDSWDLRMLYSMCG